MLGVEQICIKNPLIESLLLDTFSPFLHAQVGQTIYWCWVCIPITFLDEHILKYPLADPHHCIFSSPLHLDQMNTSNILSSSLLFHFHLAWVGWTYIKRTNVGSLHLSLFSSLLLLVFLTSSRNQQPSQNIQTYWYSSGSSTTVSGLLLLHSGQMNIFQNILVKNNVLRFLTLHLGWL